MTVLIATFSIAACSSKEPEPVSVIVMSFNVQNLFDNSDDADKDDKAYLPIDAKRNESHIAACNEIEVHGDSTWSYLDMIFFSPARGGKTTAKIRGDSVAIANGYPLQMSENGTPEPFRSEKATGVSDH